MRVNEAGQQQTARHVHHLGRRICLQVRSDLLDDPFSDQHVGRGVQAPRATAAQQQIRHGFPQTHGDTPQPILTPAVARQAGPRGAGTSRRDGHGVQPAALRVRLISG